MPIPVTCPGCAAKMRAPDTAAGKKVKCPKCQVIIPVPAPITELEVVEDEPAPPAKKPAAAPAAKPKSKTAVEIDEDDDEKPKKKPATALIEDDVDDRPRLKKRPVAEDDDDEDDRPRKKKKKRVAESEGSSLARNVIGGGVLLILLGVVGFVYYDTFGKEDETAPSAPSSGDPSTGPGSQRPGRGGPGVPQPQPEPNDPGVPQPEPNDQGGNENPYTGAGFTSGAIAEEEGEISHVMMFDISGQWFLSLQIKAPTGLPGKAGRVFLRPDQQSKINTLWPDQKIKIRGRKVETVGGTVWDFYGAEVVSTGPAPKFVEVTVDQLLKEFRDDPAAARKKWTRRGGPDEYEPPWIKLTGTFDGPGPKEIEWEGVQLKGRGSDGAKPNRIVIDTPGMIRPAVEKLKKGEPIIVRVQSLVGVEESAGQVRFTRGLFPLPK